MGKWSICEHGFRPSYCDACHPNKNNTCTICGTPIPNGNTKTCGSDCYKMHRNELDKNFRASIRDHYGTCCAICGTTTDLEIDHIFGHGRGHRNEIGTKTNSTGFYRWLKRNNYPKDYTVGGVEYLDGFRVLCSICNNKQDRIGGQYATRVNGRWRGNVEGTNQFT